MQTSKQNTIACEAIKELVEVTLRSRKDTKRAKEELKMTCHNLEMAYPNSESIKQELRLQIR
jgi:hypothetical protein